MINEPITNMNLIRSKFNSDFKDKPLFSTDESPDKLRIKFNMISYDYNNNGCEENVLETTQEIFKPKKHKRNLSFREWQKQRNTEMKSRQ